MINTSKDFSIKVFGKNYEVHAVKNKYADGNPYLTLCSKEGTFAVMSTNIEGWTPENDKQVLIKTWSENDGLLEQLIDQGLLEDTGKRIPTGFVQAHVCNVLF